jgi:hypothetical protein
MRWELWHSDGDGYSFFPEDNVEARRLLPQASKLVASFDATDSDDAHRQRNEKLGWEPYKPMK